MKMKTISWFGFNREHSHYDVFGRETRAINKVSPQLGRLIVASLILGAAGAEQVGLEALPARLLPKPRLPILGDKYWDHADGDNAHLQEQIRAICGYSRFEMPNAGWRAGMQRRWSEFKANTVIGLLGLTLEK